MKNKMKLLGVAIGALVLATTGTVNAQDKPRSLDQLLRLVQQGKTSEARQNGKREAEFKQAKNRQAALLSQAKQTRVNEENRSTRLERSFEENEVSVATKQAALKEKLGSLTELFGHITSASGDLRANLETSLTSVQYPGREVFLDGLVEKMSGNDKLPSIEEIERLWFELQREAVETGRIVKFSTEVSKPNGDTTTTDVVRVGSFNIVSSDGQYLKFDKGTLEELPRQPGEFNGAAASLASASTGLHEFGVDPTGPSGGSYLSALIDSPTMVERWHQGGTVGYIITAVGAFALIIAIWRLIVLATVGAKVSSQVKSSSPNKNNPLGRVLSVQQENPSANAETLELKLNEAVLKETPALENSLTLLKIIAAVAPLLGLLGTVTGMILTFQAITIFGAGDPKAMAGGISSALVTTVLGLCVAIPTLLLHTVVNGRSKKIMHILEEQSAGMIAKQEEANG
ncbi:MAG: MotA/TolQ/ExbB proton channel family protein [Pseudomonadales bacterium]